jgi:hypothetical protein
LFLFLAESLDLRFGPGFNFFASDIFFINTITEHAHNLYRMSSNLRSIAYDLHYCPGDRPHVNIWDTRKTLIYLNINDSIHLNDLEISK